MGYSVIFQVGVGKKWKEPSNEDFDLQELGFDPMMFNLYAMISTLNIIFAVLEEC